MIFQLCNGIGLSKNCILNFKKCFWGLVLGTVPFLDSCQKIANLLNVNIFSKGIYHVNYGCSPVNGHIKLFVGCLLDW